MDAIKERVGAYIARTGVSRESLAEKIGMSRTTFYQKLNGETEFKLGEAFALADAIGCSVDDLRKPLL
jgi:DNA-binding XRE family transcriptional regulator